MGLSRCYFQQFFYVLKQQILQQFSFVKIVKYKYLKKT